MVLSACKTFVQGSITPRCLVRDVEPRFGYRGTGVLFLQLRNQGGLVDDDDLTGFAAKVCAEDVVSWL